MVPLRHLSWDDTVRLLHTTRAKLLERLTAVDAEPSERWTRAHAFGAMLYRLPDHDRHHAAQIKDARIQG